MEDGEEELEFDEIIQRYYAFNPQFLLSSSSVYLLLRLYPDVSIAKYIVFIGNQLL